MIASSVFIKLFIDFACSITFVPLLAVSKKIVLWSYVAFTKNICCTYFVMMEDLYMYFFFGCWHGTKASKNLQDPTYNWYDKP